LCAVKVRKQVLHADTKQEPKRSVVNADQPVYMEMGAMIVPRTAAFLAEFSTGEIFCGKDTAGVKNTPGKYGGFLLL